MQLMYTDNVEIGMHHYNVYFLKSIWTTRTSNEKALKLTCACTHTI